MESLEVIGFYTLALSSLELGQKATFEGEKRGYENEVALPVVYLYMLGVDTNHMRQGVGTLLLYDAFKRVLQIAEHAGTWAITLDAYDEEAAAYYIDKFAFQRFSEGGLKLFLHIGTIMDMGLDDEERRPPPAAEEGQPVMNVPAES